MKELREQNSKENGLAQSPDQLHRYIINICNGGIHHVHRNRKYAAHCYTTNTIQLIECYTYTKIYEKPVVVYNTHPF